MRRLACLVVGAAIWALAACSSVPTDFEQTPSSALDDPATTRVYRLVEQDLEAHSWASGFTPLFSGAETFAARTAMLAMADRTIDAQYFSWEIDQTGRILIDALIRAADRGVRVRLLLDDVATGGLDLSLAHLSNLPNVELRVFNPFAARDTRAFDFLTDYSRVNRRMHNKAMIADNTLAVIGGRNIGNHYFGVDTVFNFRDLDVIAAGPIVPEISHAFDEFWNSEWAVPIEVFVDEALRLNETRRRQEILHEWVDAGADDYPYPIVRDDEEHVRVLETVLDQLIWADHVELLYDDPQKTGGEEESPIVARGRVLAGQVKREILVETAYFVPEQWQIPVYEDMASQGVRVRILTNSLTSIDVVPAFAGYSNYREELLEAGVELYELKADLEVARKYWSIIAFKSRATLHTKTSVWDRESVFVGSFNIDPRSRWINTEIGVLIHSPELAGIIAGFIESGMEPANSYRLHLNNEDGSGGQLTWIDEVDGQERRQHGEPDAPFWLKATAWFLSLLPIEDQL